jgi:hypothetical protein
VKPSAGFAGARVDVVPDVLKALVLRFLPAGGLGGGQTASDTGLTGIRGWDGLKTQSLLMHPNAGADNEGTQDAPFNTLNP